MKTPEPLSAGRALALLLAATLALRLAGLGYGLPSLYNGDEPHLVNTAVYFGSGTLRPPMLKYPTLYMYLLTALYGLWFGLLKLLGLAHQAADFAALFVWRPTGFYLIGRLASALAATGATWAVFRACQTPGNRGAGLWAAALLAVSPAVNEAAHAAKPDALMLLFASWAYLFAVRWAQFGGERRAALCGAAVGLACATQYTAAPLLVLLPAVAWARGCDPAGPGFRQEARALAFALAGFAVAGFAGSPYVLLDFTSFLANLSDLGQQMRHGGEPAGLLAMKNAALFAGAGGAVALGWGLWKLREFRALWLAPVAAYLVVLAASPQGGWERYLFGAYPALAILAGHGLQSLAARRRGAAAGLTLLLAPGLWACVLRDRELLLADTRTLSARWILDNVPAGSTLLMDSLEVCPQVPMDREQAQSLYRRTAMAGHPRNRYYRILAESHPGGGYRVLRLKREAKDLESQPGHVRWSQTAQDLLDLREGLAAARRSGVDFAVTSSFGAQPARAGYLAPFFRDLSELEPLQAFLPEGGRRAGPEIRIYKIAR